MKKTTIFSVSAALIFSSVLCFDFVSCSGGTSYTGGSGSSSSSSSSSSSDFADYISFDFSDAKALATANVDEMSDTSADSARAVTSTTNNSLQKIKADGSMQSVITVATGSKIKNITTVLQSPNPENKLFYNVFSGTSTVNKKKIGRVVAVNEDGTFENFLVDSDNTVQNILTSAVDPSDFLQIDKNGNLFYVSIDGEFYKYNAAEKKRGKITDFSTTNSIIEIKVTQNGDFLFVSEINSTASERYLKSICLADGSVETLITTLSSNYLEFDYDDIHESLYVAWCKATSANSTDPGFSFKNYFYRYNKTANGKFVASNFHDYYTDYENSTASAHYPLQPWFLYPSPDGIYTANLINGKYRIQKIVDGNGNFVPDEYYPNDSTSEEFHGREGIYENGIFYIQCASVIEYPAGGGTGTIKAYKLISFNPSTKEIINISDKANIPDQNISFMKVANGKLYFGGYDTSHNFNGGIVDLSTYSLTKFDSSAELTSLIVVR